MIDGLEQGVAMYPNPAQEYARGRRHGYLEALTEGTARKLVELLRRGVRQLEAWHATYGAHQPEWLPPAGDVRWLEDVAAELVARAAIPPVKAQGEATGAVTLLRDAVVSAAQKWGDADTDDDVATLAAELELAQALSALAEHHE